ncbi:hypothetical protein B0T19DRAFT_274921 [Cercophora scortea]|uniref:Uncharacterized protein n=1 Tax=Cercophora scortea TaxID=314031 RepID=A0AAE0I870_9PEZI|nr:hypothetical protein B0T19DRAFT_274921 [Cercophora scortea]
MTHPAQNILVLLASTQRATWYCVHSGFAQHQVPVPVYVQDKSQRPMELRGLCLFGLSGWVVAWLLAWLAWLVAWHLRAPTCEVRMSQYSAAWLMHALKKKRLRAAAGQAADNLTRRAFKVLTQAQQGYRTMDEGLETVEPCPEATVAAWKWKVLPLVGGRVVLVPSALGTGYVHHTPPFVC